MRFMNRKLIIGIALSLAMMAIVAQAQTYTVDWFKLAGGAAPAPAGVIQ